MKLEIVIMNSDLPKMNCKEIKDEIKFRSKKSKFYKDLLIEIEKQPEILEFLDYQDFNHPLDLIKFLES